MTDKLVKQNCESERYLKYEATWHFKYNQARKRTEEKSLSTKKKTQLDLYLTFNQSKFQINF